MEQNIFDYLVEGLDLNAFYSFIDIDKNTPKFVFQYTTWSALFNGIIRSDEEDDKKVHVFSTNCQNGEYSFDSFMNWFIVNTAIS